MLWYLLNVGCYRYSDGSAMFLVNIETCKYSWTLNKCILEKDIKAPIEATNNHCSIQWGMTQFFNYSDWELLPFKDEIFTIVERNHYLTLKVRSTLFMLNIHLFISTQNIRYITIIMLKVSVSRQIFYTSFLHLSYCSRVLRGGTQGSRFHVSCRKI